ncbi:alpha/beta hydrolase [Stappia stellulata]|uniref:alpha/beta hydrolase n=1 Tax=Stappia stellulata TaxID=71235 RepID=UPI00041277C7|nr:alpha/beta-hydrolase family protein [Stappia stellulata]
MIRWKEISLAGLVLGLLFFAASLTPSLIPRDAMVQGVLGGLVMALGYLSWWVVRLIWRFADMPEPSGAPKRWLLALLALGALGLFLWTLFSNLTWQNDLRAKMGMPLADGLDLIPLMLAAILTFSLCFAVGAFLAWLVRLVRARLLKVMPERRANVLALALVGLVLFVVTRDGVYDQVVTRLDSSYETAQELFDTAPPPPENPDLTGGANSLIDWGGVGTPGRNFVLGGPDAEAISAFTGAPALDPIRVYVGRANGETAEERAELALAELERRGAFEREVLVVASPTGTGWLDPGSHDPLEYMHGGDIATVAVQYSYLQSPLALILETATGLDQATALLETVHRHWQTLPAGERPRLYVHGLSLGAWSSMHATNLFRLVNDPIDGAFWAGPPFPSAFWRYVQNARNEGSPWVLPRIGDGSFIRYANHFQDASHGAAWSDMRIVFLQYSSDPIVFYDPFSVWRAPPWMRDPPAPDASAHMIFMPIVTQFQLALDMALSFGAPAGHGHAYYAQDYIDPWIEVSAPAGWTSEDTERLKAHCDLGFKNGCNND